MTQLCGQFINFYHSLDSFQGVFRDRECSGCIFAFSTSLAELFLLTEIALLSFFTVHIMAQPYKRMICNIIDPLNMAIINSLSWFVFAISTESEGGGTAEGVTALKLMLMYLPIGLLMAYVFLLFFRKTGVIRNKFQLGSSEGGNYSGKVLRGVCNDEDLFAHAEELKHPALILASGKEGFILQTTENRNNSSCY